MSTVYRAFDETLERWVAIKILHADMSQDDSQLERFRREARSAARLSHPHVVTVIDAGEDDGRPFIVFEYVEGETLKERIRRLGRLPGAAGLGARPPAPALAGPFLESYQAIFGWLLADHPTTVDAASTADMMRRYNALRGAEGFGGLQLPPEHFVLMRAVFLLIGLLGQLRARGTWLDIAGEWLFGAAPATGLGLAEDAFFAHRHRYELVEGTLS